MQPMDEYLEIFSIRFSHQGIGNLQVMEPSRMLKGSETGFLQNSLQQKHDRLVEEGSVFNDFNQMVP
jgi:hypothetical protein